MLFVKGVSTLEKDSMAKSGVILGSPMAKFVIDSDWRSPVDDTEGHTLNTAQLLTFSVFLNRAK